MVSVTGRVSRALVRGPDLAGVAGSGLRFALSSAAMLRGLAGLLLLAFGAWLAWPPAGFMVLGAGLLADRIADERRPRERRPE